MAKITEKQENKGSLSDCSETETERREEKEDFRDERDRDREEAVLHFGMGEAPYYTLSVIGQIEGHFVLPQGQKSTKYEHILPLLVDLEQDERVKGILVLLNTMGGDVEAGLAIAELIASMQKPTVSLVLGGSHSIGVPLAVAAKKSFIVPSATMTIHPVRVTGTVLGVPQTYRYFADMQERIVRFITTHSGVSRAKLTELLLRPDEMATDVGSVVDGEEAVRLGLIGQIGGALGCHERAQIVIRRVII